MDVEQAITRLFTRLRASSRQYSLRLTLTAEAERIALRVDSADGEADASLPRFDLRVAPSPDGFRVSYRPTGDGAPSPDRINFPYDIPGVEREVYDFVQRLVDGESKRLMEYRERT
jgi:hypothetical protein